MPKVGQQLQLWPGIQYRSAGINHIALHEAAHAVVAVRQAAKFDFITIKRTKDSLGSICFKEATISEKTKQYDDIKDDDVSVARVIARRYVALAGVVIETCCKGNLEAAKRDLESVTWMTMVLANGKEDIAAQYNKFSLLGIEADFNKGHIWEAVEAVALQLERKKTLTFDEVASICRRMVIENTRPEPKQHRFVERK